MDTNILGQLFFNNPAPMWIYSKVTGKVLKANNSALKVYGYTKNEFEELTHSDLLFQSVMVDDSDSSKAGLSKHLTVHQNSNGAVFLTFMLEQPLTYQSESAVLVRAIKVFKQ